MAFSRKRAAEEAIESVEPSGRFRHQSFPPAGHASLRPVGQGVAQDAKVLGLSRDSGRFGAEPLEDGTRVRILIGTDAGGLEIDGIVIRRDGDEDDKKAEVRVRFERVSRLAVARIPKQKPSAPPVSES